MEMIKKLLLAMTVSAISLNAVAQHVKNTSYVSGSGEKVLRLELLLSLDRKEAWKLFTTDAQIKRWMAPVAHIELQTGGFILTNYDKTQSLEDSSTIELGIINYLDHELITFKVNLNDHFPAKVRKEDGNLQELIRFESVGKGKTRITSSMIGWGKGSDWDKTYDFFAKGNAWTYEELWKLVK